MTDIGERRLKIVQGHVIVRLKRGEGFRQIGKTERQNALRQTFQTVGQITNRQRLLFGDLGALGRDLLALGRGLRRHLGILALQHFVGRVLLGKELTQILDHRRRQRDQPGVRLVVDAGFRSAGFQNLADDVVGVIGPHSLELIGDLLAGADRRLGGVVGNDSRHDEPNHDGDDDDGDRYRRDQPLL